MLFELLRTNSPLDIEPSPSTIATGLPESRIVSGDGDGTSRIADAVLVVLPTLGDRKVEKSHLLCSQPLRLAGRCYWV